VSDFAVPEAPGIHGLAIPTPFAIGRVNCWLIDDEPLTLFDCGPNSGKALDELEQRLADHGRRVEDLERIVITHQHIDHLGLVGILARRSGAEICTLAALAPLVERFGEYAEADDEMAAELMVRHGVPSDVATALKAVSRAFRGWGGSADVTVRLEAGGVLQFAGRRLDVLHRPGHSPSDTVFWDAERGVLIGGDHLIGKVSSNPLIARPLDGDATERPKALLTYMASLRATRELPAAVVLPGHGEPVRGHAALIDDRFAMHERRAAKIARLIAERPRSAHEIAQSLWGSVALTQAYLTLSEVLGHVDLLAERGEVAETEEDGVVRFSAA
jgi:glyoxylase-like metal-dependent hydrolase (beta-lactamase superfamily II)